MGSAAAVGDLAAVRDEAEAEGWRRWWRWCSAQVCCPGPAAAVCTCSASTSPTWCATSPERYVNYTAGYTAGGRGGHLAVDTKGGVEFNGPGSDTVHEVVDVDSDALYAIFVKAVAASYHSGSTGMPTLSDLVEAIRPIAQTYSDS